MTEIIYKILSASEWEAGEAAGAYHGSEDDRRDGFIHFSTAAQAAAASAKHFAGRDGLMLLAVDAAALGEALKWEPSPGGELFPHLYGSLPVSAVLSAAPLPLGPDGRHIFPAGLPQ